MRRLFAVASAVLTVGTLAVADAEGDMAACADKKSPDAMAACTRLIDAGQLPADKLAEVYDQRARVRLSGGDTDSGLTDYDAAIRLAPADGVIRMRRGGVLLQRFGMTALASCSSSSSRNLALS
jgi:hypothetical protein